jgi:nucleoside-diphosphate-sugar epimerase
MSGRSVVLIGGTGYIGSRLAAALASRQVPVVTVGRRAPAEVLADMADPALDVGALADRLSPAGAVVDLAASPRSPASIVHAARGVAELVRAMRTRTAPLHLLHFGSVSERARPPFRSAYGRAKREARRALKDAADAFTLPGLVFGGNPRMDRDLANLATVFERHTQLLDGFRLGSVHVDRLAADVARAIAERQTGELRVEHRALTLRELCAASGVCIEARPGRRARARLALESARCLARGNRRLALFFWLAALAGRRSQARWNHYMTVALAPQESAS